MLQMVACKQKKMRVKPHTCPINHIGSSGSMEAKLALELTLEMHTKTKGRDFVESIISDNDSTMRSLLKHKISNIKGQLDEGIPQHVFLAYPSHQIK